MNKQPKPNRDYTINKRQAARRESLNQIANEQGYASWQKLETAVLKAGKVGVGGPQTVLLRGYEYSGNGLADTGFDEPVPTDIMDRYIGHVVNTFTRAANARYPKAEIWVATKTGEVFGLYDYDYGDDVDEVLAYMWHDAKSSGSDIMVNYNTDE